MPLLNGSRPSCGLRVPSGKTISEAPWSSAPTIGAIGSAPRSAAFALDQHAAKHAVDEVAAQAAAAQ